MSKKADKILKAAIDLLIRDGVKKTTMDDIAAYSKTSKVTIYKYFTDKDTFYFEIGRSVFAYYTEKLKSIISSGEALVKRLYDCLGVISDFTDSGKFDLCKELALYNHAVDAEYAAYLQTYRASVLALIDEGLEYGLIKNSLDRDIVFYFIDMGVVYYQQNEEYRNKMRGNVSFREKFMQFYMSQIFADGAGILPPDEAI